MTDADHTVLCVDDEINILNALKRLLRREPYRLLTSTSGEEALDLLAGNNVQVVISDQRMPKMSGIDFLRKVKELYPRVIRVILTGYTEVDTITQSINEGHIYKFFLKPWNDQHLTLEIRQAIEQYQLVEDNQRLYDMTVEQNEELRRINENLEQIVSERTESLERQNRVLQLSHAILGDLPVPIIGISAEGIVVLVNNAVHDHFGDKRLFAPGESITKVIGNLDDQRLAQMIYSGQRQEFTAESINGAFVPLVLWPLSGQYAGSGAILTTLSSCCPKSLAPKSKTSSPEMTLAKD
ncbi:MAG: response regulator [Desulfatitalea sp.]|nr:response regulator [Desulfatitalea sp.]NNJ99120.1 response regulator [Desulfatitalea sp.]